LAVESDVFTEPGTMREGQASVEQLIASRRTFQGRIIGVRIDEVELETGRRTTREVVEHPGAVAVVPVLDDGTLVLVRQYRHAVERELLELPAGTRELGEPTEETAVRELQEETGYRATEWELLTRFFISPGWCNEELSIYRANGLMAVEQALEEDEHLTVAAVRPSEISGLMRDGVIADAKTITGLLLHLESHCK
jgi:ADP-ribose pyrophosphatase